MGIPGFGLVIAELFGQRLQVTVLPGKVTVLAIDGNGMVHTSTGFAYGYSDKLKPQDAAFIAQQPSETKLFNARAILLDSIRTVTQAVRPDTLMFCMDGIANASKLKQQRQRRYRSAILRNAAPEAPLPPTAGMGQVTGLSARPASFDNSAITTGTPFMDQIHAWLTSYFTQGQVLGVSNIIYSSHRRVGEGEHIIMDLARQGTVKDDGGLFVIYGLDADWFILAMRIPWNHVYLARNSLTEYMSVSLFRRLMLEEYNADADDTLILSMLLGNDHIPCMASMLDKPAGWPRALQIHRDSKQHLHTADGDIDWKALGRFMTLLAAEEPTLLNGDRVKQFDILLNQDSYAKQYNAWYMRALTPKVPIPAQAFKSPELNQALGELQQVTPERIAALTRSWLDMVIWVYNFYRLGTRAVSFDVYYPYDFAPLVIDIAQALSPESVLPAMPVPATGTPLGTLPAGATTETKAPAPSEASCALVAGGTCKEGYRPPTCTWQHTGIYRWELETMIAAGIFPEWQERTLRDWLASNPQLVLAEDSATMRTVRDNYIFPRRLLAQLFLVIPPPSLSVLSEDQRRLILEAVELEYLRPRNALIETSNIRVEDLRFGQLEAKLATLPPAEQYYTQLEINHQMHQLKRRIESFERLVYLPMEYISVYRHFLTKQIPRSAPPDELMLLAFTSRQLQPYAVVSAAGGVAPLGAGVYPGMGQVALAGPVGGPGGGRGRGRGGERGRGRGRARMTVRPSRSAYPSE